MLFKKLKFNSSSYTLIWKSILCIISLKNKGIKRIQERTLHLNHKMSGKEKGTLTTYFFLKIFLFPCFQPTSGEGEKWDLSA